MDNFKGNPNVGREKKSTPSEKSLAPVTNNVIVKKETEVKKFAKNFISEDVKSVKGHVFMNVIVPGIQRLLSEGIKSAVDGIIYGVRGIRNETIGARNISYSTYYDRNRVSYGSTGLPPVPSSAYTKSNVYSANEVEFIDRGEAEEVLFRLKEEIERYGLVSIGDFYDLIGQKHYHTDLKYGWRDLRDAEVVRARDRYRINFPKIIPLE